MIWKFKAAWRLKFKYHFDWDEARELAAILYHNEGSQFYKPADYVDEEMSYWGD